MTSVCWKGQIHADGVAHPITLTAPHGGLALPETSALSFLSLVDLSRIPLHLVTGPQCEVTSEDLHTQQWFCRFLLPEHAASPDSGRAWWATARPDSSLGILVSVDPSIESIPQSSPRVTELLFYASQILGSHGRPPTPPPSSPTTRSTDSHISTTPRLVVRCIAISSDLAVPQAEPNPPCSPVNDPEADAVFFASTTSVESEVINVPPIRKRKSVNDTFDQATERRRKARRKGGEGVAAAAAIKTEGSLPPSLKHRRSEGGSHSQPVRVTARSPSRSSSVASSRPTTATARAPSEATKRSSLSHVQSTQSVGTSLGEATIELANRELISRIVMAGMRLYGLSQSKSRKSRASSIAVSTAADHSRDQDDEERDNDEEYKLVYHQVFKGTCFAFRHQFKAVTLQPHTEGVRETSDRLLAIFCNDPLQPGLPGMADNLTPGGRKAFLGAGAGMGADHSPYTAPLTHDARSLPEGQHPRL